MIRGSHKPLKTVTRQISSKAPFDQSSHHVSIQSPLVQALPSHLSAFSQPPTNAQAQQEPPIMTTRPPLAVLPLSMVLRSIMINTVSSSPILLRPSMIIMSKLAHATSPILSPDRNPVLHWVLKHTFYNQFCAGENRAEVARTVGSIKSLGFRGVILAYAKEVELSEEEKAALKSPHAPVSEDCIKTEVEPWKVGTLETVALAEPGDFVALKFTGAGREALFALSNNLPPSPALKSAIDAVCDLAASRDVRVLFDAEQQAVQAGIDAWTLDYMRRYNKQGSGKAVIYGTYQGYLKGAPKLLASHLAVAQQDGFTLGVKLVRGAYIGSDPRNLIHDTKADTDAAYDGIAEALMRREYNDVLTTPEGKSATPFPAVDVVLASHNLKSVRKAQAVRSEQKLRDQPQINMVYAQLQGMADDVSCELVQCARERAVECEKQKKDIPQAYKYLVWGSTGECMKYLLRRAQENKDAVQRTRDGRNAMIKELARRMKALVGAA